VRSGRRRRAETFRPGGPNAGYFRELIEDASALPVPSLSRFEIYRHMVQHSGREGALSVVAAMQKGAVIDLDDRLALEAAELSIDTRLSLTDSVMLATARSRGAELWTQGSDFEGLEDVRYFMNHWSA
jgi:predicted nucleic acid-binding protein